MKRISVMINTYNEERHIRNCLASVRWADEIVLVDMHSTDRTVEMAREYTDRIFFFENVGYADPARQFALEKTTGDWVLMIDADEMVPMEMHRELVDIMEADTADVVYVPHNNYFFGTMVRGSEFGPLQDMHPRFFRRGCVNFGECVHDFFRVAVGARVYGIDDPAKGFIHFNFTDIEHFLHKQNLYTTIEARNIYEGKKQAGGPLWFLFRKAIGGFALRFFLKKGYTDGLTGFFVSFYRSVVYYLNVYVKLRMMRQYGAADPRGAVLETYDAVAKKVIDEYGKDRAGNHAGRGLRP